MGVALGDRKSKTVADWGELVSVAIGFAYAFAAAAALLYAKDALRFIPDETEYLTLGQNLLKFGVYAYDGVTPTAFRPPGWPALIAVLWWIWPSVYCIKIFNLGCWAATGFVVARLSSSLCGSIAGRLAAVLYLGYIFELFAATTLYPQTTLGLLVILSLALVVRETKLTLAGQLALLSMNIIQILMVPNSIVVAVILYLYAALTRRITFRSALFAGLAILLVICAWCLRNEQAVGGFTFSTNDGLTLALGNNSNATAASGTHVDITALEDRAHGLSELNSDRFYRSWAYDWIHHHARRALTLTLEKFAFWFNYKNEYESAVDSSSERHLSLVMSFLYYPVLIGSLMAIGVGRGRLQSVAALAWLLNVTVALTYVMFLTRIRYRLPFDPLLFVAAASLIEQLRQKRRPGLKLSAQISGSFDR
jgi:hypothetical protein